MPSSKRLDAIADIADLLASRRGPWKRVLDPEAADPIGSAERLLQRVRSGDHASGTGDADMLAQRVLDRLKLQLMLVEVGPPADSIPWTRRIAALRDLISATTLLAYGRRRAAMYILERAYVSARETETTFAELMCLQLMRTNASLTADLRSVDRIDREVQRMREIDDAEQQAEYMEERVAAILASTSSRRKNDARLTHSYAATIDDLRRKYDRHLLHLTYFRLASRAFQQDVDDAATVKVCREARAYYRRKPQFATPTRIGEFTFKEMVSLIALRRLDEALGIIDEVRDQLSSNMGAWPVVLEHLFQLHAMQGDMNAAADVCLEVRGIRHRLRSQHQRDAWRYREAVLHTMADIGVGDSSDIESRLGRSSFYLGNLRRSLASLAKDRHGVDVGLQILGLIRLMDRKRYNDIVAGREALAQYVKRYVRDATLRRSNIFLRMLLRIARYDFDPVDVERGCHDLYVRLTELQIDDDAEIVPYERLWQAILILLERNQHSERRRR
jgi:hypothetical protein